MSIMPMSAEAWRLAAQAIAEGELVVFPTDTVYGVACDPYNRKAIGQLFEAKGRGLEKAIPLLLAGPEQAQRIAGQFPQSAALLGEALWPGALTLVVPRGADLPEELGGGATIAVRVPNHNELRSFLAACGGALAVTSANISGEPDALTAQESAAYLGDKVEVIIDGGQVPGGVPSTVVNCAVNPGNTAARGDQRRKHRCGTRRAARIAVYRTSAYLSSLPSLWLAWH